MLALEREPAAAPWVSEKELQVGLLHDQGKNAVLMTCCKCSVPFFFFLIPLEGGEIINPTSKGNSLACISAGGLASRAT